MSTESIVRYTSEELKQKAARGESRTDIASIEAMSDEETERRALDDLDEHGIPADWYKNAEKQLSKTKVLVSLRIDPDLLEYHRGTGKGWQTRMNAILLAHMNVVTVRKG